MWSTNFANKTPIQKIILQELISHMKVLIATNSRQQLFATGAALDSPANCVIYFEATALNIERKLL